MSDFNSLTASELGDMIGQGEIDPVELTEHFLSRIQSSPIGKKIYSTVTSQLALEQAKDAKKRAISGRRLSSLDGVPISWKDLFDIKGYPCEAGSELLAGRLANQNCEVYNLAEAQGLICLGKTHMSELAFSGLGLNPVRETPPCVNYPESVPGGSSSGAATSVSFGLATAGIGSDTGGSVRIPAAWNDLVGFKTTAGRLSLDGVVPLCSRFDTVGPLTKSVEDAARLFGVMSGREIRLPTPKAVKGLKLGILKNVAMENVVDLPKKAFESAINKLKEAGASISEIFVSSVDEAMDLTGFLYSPEAYATWKHKIEKTPDLMFVKILERFRSGANVLASDFICAWDKLMDLRQQYHSAVKMYDAVLIPTSPIIPPELDRLMNDGDFYNSQNLLALRNTRIGNLMGGCSITLPTDIPSCGLLIMGMPSQEERLLRLAQACELVLSRNQ
ncbi:amidase family protein [Paracoccaceae bacterium]|nr:amidase family protein [Paracoccaceae bacterium]